MSKYLFLRPRTQPPEAPSDAARQISALREEMEAKIAALAPKAGFWSWVGRIFGRRG